MANPISLRGLRQFGQHGAVVLAILALLTVSLLFGGASRQHELRLVLVELTGLSLAVLALTALLKREDTEPHRSAFLLVAAAACLPLVQLIPLPPAIWTALPGRDPLALALDLAGLPQGWLPLSLTPDRTWRSFLAVLPPIAMFLAVLATRPESRRFLVLALLGGILVSILLGAAQFVGGGERLYPWATTDAGSVTGFFANRNHLATLCLIGIPFATVLGVGALRRRDASRLPLWIAVLFVALSVIALGIIRSRAGVVLFGPVIGASLLAAWIASGRGRPKLLLLGIVGGSVLAVVAVAAFAAAPLLERFDNGSAREGRFENWPTILEGAQAYLPLGSGLGSFDAVYRSIEPLERLDATFFNQAHNDYLETWLEAGWLGAALIIAFLVWYGRRLWTAWRAGVSTQRDLQRAASIAVGAVLLHSFVDYPLRTETIAIVFAFCCGLLELAALSEARLNPSGSRRRTRR